MQMQHKPFLYFLRYMLISGLSNVCVAAGINYVVTSKGAINTTTYEYFGIMEKKVLYRRVIVKETKVQVTMHTIFIMNIVKEWHPVD